MKYRLFDNMTSNNLNKPLYTDFKNEKIINLKKCKLKEEKLYPISKNQLIYNKFEFKMKHNIPIKFSYKESNKSGFKDTEMYFTIKDIQRDTNRFFIDKKEIKDSFKGYILTVKRFI